MGHNWFRFTTVPDVVQKSHSTSLDRRAIMGYGVEGCHMDMKEFPSRIAFNTPSDAVFASLYFKHEGTLQMEFLDDFLSAFRHPDFDSKTVTFRKSEDIFDHIAEQRQAIMKERNTKSSIKSSLSTTAGDQQIPGLIPELLADYYDSADRSSFHATIPFRRCYASRCLARMALVHRSWANIAQRYLRRRFYINGDHETLRTLLQSPHFDAGVRELSVCGEQEVLSAEYIEQFCSFDHPHSIPEGIQSALLIFEIPRLLHTVLMRCPNLTYLHLKDFDLTSIHQISNLGRLEHLWLDHPSTERLVHEDLWGFLLILPDFRSLRSLKLENWDVSYAQDFTDDVFEPGPPATLESVSLQYINITSSGLLSWLMNPRNENHIKNLELAYDDMICIRDQQMVLSAPVQRFIDNGMAKYIKTLQIVDCEECDGIETIIEGFQSLQSLSLHMSGDYGLPTEPIILHKSIESFRLFYYHKPARNQCPLALAIIKANPQLQSMRVYTKKSISPSHGSKLPPELDFKDTRAFVEAKTDGINIRFVVYKVEHRPHFLD